MFICTDMDAAGKKVIDRVWALTNEAPFQHISVKPYPPLIGNDYNDTLQALLKEQRTQGRPALSERKGRDL